MNSLVLLQFELRRAQAQLAKYLGKPPAPSSISPEAERDNAIAPQRWREMEFSFADLANQADFERARWQGLVKHLIQDLVIATVQTLRKLVCRVGVEPCAARLCFGLGTRNSERE